MEIELQFVCLHHWTAKGLTYFPGILHFLIQGTYHVICP